jgi:hypothetical protein
MSITVPSDFQYLVLFTLLLAGQMILLVVLYGRDRMRLYPWFSASIMLTAFKTLVDKILFERISQIPFEFIKNLLGVFTVLVGLGVLVEIARKLFPGVTLMHRVIASGFITLITATVVYFWGPWTANGDIGFKSQIGVVNLLLVASTHGEQILLPCATILLGIFVLFVLRHQRGFWQSHTIKIFAGLTTCSLMFLVMRATAQTIAITANTHGMTMKEFAQIQGMMDQFRTLPLVTLIIVQFWWIYALWNEEGEQKKTASSK